MITGLSPELNRPKPGDIPDVIINQGIEKLSDHATPSFHKGN